MQKSTGIPCSVFKEEMWILVRKGWTNLNLNTYIYDFYVIAQHSAHIQVLPMLVFSWVTPWRSVSLGQECPTTGPFGFQADSSPKCAEKLEHYDIIHQFILSLLVCLFIVCYQRGLPRLVIDFNQLCCLTLYPEQSDNFVCHYLSLNKTKTERLNFYLFKLLYIYLY